MLREPRVPAGQPGSMIQIQGVEPPKNRSSQKASRTVRGVGVGYSGAVDRAGLLIQVVVVRLVAAARGDQRSGFTW
jgi:hypothetical protein